MTLDIKRASRETLEELAIVLDECGWPGELLPGRVGEVRKKLRSECAPPKLRTRSERDREISDLLAAGRERGRDWECPCAMTREVRVKIAQLLAEPTTDTAPAPSEDTAAQQLNELREQLADRDVASIRDAKRIAELEKDTKRLTRELALANGRIRFLEELARQMSAEAK